MLERHSPGSPMTVRLVPLAVLSALPARPSRQYGIEEFVASTGLTGASFTHDESRILFSSNRTGVWNAWTVPRGGGEWTARTSSVDHNVYGLSAFPADDRLLVTRSVGGDELDHLSVVSPDGTEHDLTPGVRLKAMFGGFTRDGAHLWIQTNERDPRFFDLYRYDTATYARELWYGNHDGIGVELHSDDGRWLVLLAEGTTHDNELYLFDRITRARVHLTPHVGASQFSAEAFSPDGRFLFYLTNDGSEFFRVRSYDLLAGTHADVLSAPWDVTRLGFSHDGTYRYHTVNEDGSTRVMLVETATGAEIALPALPAGDIRGIVVSRSEKRLAFYLNGDRQPNELYTFELGAVAPVALTRSLNPAIDPADLVDSTVVRFPSADGTVIPNILWRPHQATAERPAPALVWVHGGPGGQTTRSHDVFLQFIANHGYVVLGINNRGSSGYGKTFYAADHGRHGREPLTDCLSARDWLTAQDYVDPQRIGIIGGSYGGYMALAALAFHPEVFDVGVDLFGVSNWIRTLQGIPPWWEIRRRALYLEIGNPDTQLEMLREISPLFHAARIRRPLMVLQGANDPRVLRAESDDIVAAVKKNGVPVEYVVFPDEGHGFTKKPNEIRGYGAVMQFLDRHLAGTRAAT